MKKTLLLISIAAAAFAAPAAQADPLWTEGSLGEFEATGQITTVIGALLIGPAVLDIQGSRFNAGEMASGSIGSGTFTGSIPTNLPGCTATGSSNASEETPWPITFTTPDTVDIGSEDDPVVLTKHYGAGCAPFGVPPTISGKGVITGTYEEAEGEICVSLNTYTDDLKNVVGGTVDLSNPEGKPLCIPGELE